MNIPASISPMSVGQSCTICFVDGAMTWGDLVYCDDGFIALDNVVTSSSRDDELTGGLGLFPIVQIRWIKPNTDDHPGTL